MMFLQTAGGTDKRRERRKSVDKKKSKRACVFSSEEDCVKMLRAYFTERIAESGEVPDIEGLAEFLHTTRDELFRLKEHRVYGEYLGRAFNSIAKAKKQLAFAGKLPAAVLSFDLKNNHGYRDKPEERSETGTTVVFRGMTEEWAK